MIATAIEGKGRVGVVVPHGVLFRGGQEGKIREAVLRENLLAGVVISEEHTSELQSH